MSLPAATWQTPDGRAKLWLGDCLKLLSDLDAGSIGAVVTDPPYGIAHRSHGQHWRAARPIEGDDSRDLALSICEWAEGLPLAMFFSPYAPLAVHWRSLLVWDKGAHVGIGGDRKTCWKRDFEMIGVRGNRPLNGKRDSAVLNTFPALSPPPTGHFAEKPVPLLAYLVGKLTADGMAVLDPCMGTGATGVACMRTGRRFLGMEIDPTYFEIARARIEAAAEDSEEKNP